MNSQLEGMTSSRVVTSTRGGDAVLSVPSQLCFLVAKTSEVPDEQRKQVTTYQHEGLVVASLREYAL